MRYYNVSFRDIAWDSEISTLPRNEAVIVYAANLDDAVDIATNVITDFYGWCVTGFSKVIVESVRGDISND